MVKPHRSGRGSGKPADLLLSGLGKALGKELQAAPKHLEKPQPTQPHGVAQPQGAKQAGADKAAVTIPPRNTSQQPNEQGSLEKRSQAQQQKLQEKLAKSPGSKDSSKSRLSINLFNNLGQDGRGRSGSIAF